MELNFPDSGLLPAIAQQYDSGEVLMLAWVSKESIAKTIETGQVHYYSRSRQEIWHKGLTSGNIQELRELRFDCDKDAVLFLVNQIGPACHTNRRSCFYYSVQDDGVKIISSPEK